jgi:hypothetical protein
MRCFLCRDRAGWWRRTCGDCRRLLAVWQEHRGAGMRVLLAEFRQTGVAPEKIERFLNAEPAYGQGAIRDQIAADMTNQLLDALGQGGRQTRADVKRLRERGAWKGFDRPPE